MDQWRDDMRVRMLERSPFLVKRLLEFSVVEMRRKRGMEEEEEKINRQRRKKVKEYGGSGGRGKRGRGKRKRGKKGGGKMGEGIRHRKKMRKKKPEVETKGPGKKKDG